MSLYNLVHGTNPSAAFVLAMLGSPAAPRFRDAWIDTQSEKTCLAIHTRTGGGNRAFYDSPDRYAREYGDEESEPYTGPWNSDLRKIDGFLFDEDDDFDSTYATFYFSVPKEFTSVVDTLVAIGAGRSDTPGDAWQRALDDLKSGQISERSQGIMSAMEPIFAKISEALSGGKEAAK